MRIKSFEYHNKKVGWHLKPVALSDLTLLVGVSGVGKTQILRAILDIRDIAKGDSTNGLFWDIQYSNDGEEYHWSGEFETIDRRYGEPFENGKEDDEEVTGNKPRILSESLMKRDHTIIERDETRIVFDGAETPRLSPFKSALHLLSQEPEVAAARDAFKRIVFSDHSISTDAMKFIHLIESGIKKYNSLKRIRESGLDTYRKLYLLYENVRPEFDRIVEKFIEIFPQVESVEFSIDEDMRQPGFLKPMPVLQIKEENVTDAIKQYQISSGMYRTIMHLAEIHLWPEETVILIDEFENSLGVNCLDVLTDDMSSNQRKLQFVLTSHHPYIINNINPKFLKIVTRRGGVVEVKDADPGNITGSSHDAFMQLINNEEYREGIATQ